MAETTRTPVPSPAGAGWVQGAKGPPKAAFLNVRLPFRLVQTVKLRAVRERKTLQELVRDALEMYEREAERNEL